MDSFVLASIIFILGKLSEHVGMKKIQVLFSASKLRVASVSLLGFPVSGGMWWDVHILYISGNVLLMS